MLIEGNLRKMQSELIDDLVHYNLNLHDVLEPLEAIDLNKLLGKKIVIEYLGYANSILSGEKLKKTFGEGLSYKEWRDSPQAVESIMKPELSKIHEGVALRDYEWEMKHHMKPHAVYLSLTSDVKVGVTRTTQIPYRWIDQGASQALKIAETPYRQAAGLIEVALKNRFKDKTAWQKMLKNEMNDANLLEQRDIAFEELSEDLMIYASQNNSIQNIEYPVLEFPSKVKSLKLEKEKIIEGQLMGIKGQYLIFDGGRVTNIRSQSGFRVRIELGK